ncbi:MAG: hypothetical protein WC840_04430 [Candidatus Peribacteraceae bacterium]
MPVESHFPPGRLEDPWFSPRECAALDMCHVLETMIDIRKRLASCADLPSAIPQILDEIRRAASEVEVNVTLPDPHDPVFLETFNRCCDVFEAEVDDYFD